MRSGQDGHRGYDGRVKTQCPNADESRLQKPGAEAGETYWVQCDGYRTLAVKGADGRWKSAHDHREVTGVIGFFPTEEAPY